MKTKIKELCQVAGITTAYQLQKKTDLSPSQAARLYKDAVEAMSLSVLEKLCDVLKCSPNDIFGYNESQTVKPQSAKPKAEKPVERSETPKTTVSDGDLLTTEQVAARLSINERTVRDNYTNGKLPFVKIGTKNFVRESDLLKFEEERKTNKK
jgi:excisionase family DNA binding protein